MNSFEDIKFDYSETIRNRPETCKIFMDSFNFLKLSLEHFNMTLF